MLIILGGKNANPFQHEEHSQQRSKYDLFINVIWVSMQMFIPVTLFFLMLDRLFILSVRVKYMQAKEKTKDGLKKVGHCAGNYRNASLVL